jgi:3-isopropylmalate dehydrogenase
MRRYKVALIPGDGIGPELTDATMKVLYSVEDKYGIKLEFKSVEAGDVCLAKRGEALPDESIDSIKDSDVCLKGPVGESAAQVIVKLRLMFDLYANIRPIKAYPGVPSLSPKIDMVFVRENTEDVYRGIEFSIDDSAFCLRVITKKGCTRIAKKAFEVALKRNKNKKVTAVHKANVMKVTDGLFRKICKDVAKNYPQIIFEEQYVDAMAMRLIKQPENFDVIVIPNMFGDILSDEAAQLIGGLGMAPGGNIGDDFAIFEPIHGSAPSRVGKHNANPCSMILATKIMFEWLGETFKDQECFIAAESIEKALIQSLSKGLTIPDLGGTLTTVEMGKAIANELSEL